MHQKCFYCKKKHPSIPANYAGCSGFISFEHDGLKFTGYKPAQTCEDCLRDQILSRYNKHVWTLFREKKVDWSYYAAEVVEAQKAKISDEIIRVVEMTQILMNLSFLTPYSGLAVISNGCLLNPVFHTVQYNFTDSETAFKYGNAMVFREEFRVIPSESVGEELKRPQTLIKKFMDWASRKSA
jgi:hypothetical protein